MIVQNELLEIIEVNQATHTLTAINTGHPYFEIKNVKTNNSKNKAVQLNKENEQRICKMLKGINSYQWNLSISLFFGANCYAMDRINYSMPSITKNSGND